MAQKILAVVDTTDRSDGDILQWDAGGNTHVYVAPGGAASAAVIANEFKNWPTIEGVDNGQPEWWEVNANCTLTDVDIAGESITETFERGMKAVTSADSYFYQLFTYADEPRIKSGRTVSVRVAVWAVGGVTARVRLQSSVGSLDVGTTTAAAWTIITLDGVVLDGTTVAVRCEVATGTAYFVPLAFGIGDTAPHELAPRGTRFRWADQASVKSFSGLGDENTWTDVDCTSATSPLCCMVQVFAQCLGVSGSSWDVGLRRNGSAIALSGIVTLVSFNSNAPVRHAGGPAVIPVDDGQIFEYCLDRWSGSGTLGADSGIYLWGWWEWS